MKMENMVSEAAPWLGKSITYFPAFYIFSILLPKPKPEDGRISRIDLAQLELQAEGGC